MIPRARLDEVLLRQVAFAAPPQESPTLSYRPQPGFLPIGRDDRPDAKVGVREKTGWRWRAYARPAPALQKILDQCRAPRPWSFEIITRQDGLALFLRDRQGQSILLTIEAPNRTGS